MPNMSTDSHDLQANEGKGVSRCVYIAPLEALARQRYADWEARFGQAGLGLKVSLFTVRNWKACVQIAHSCSTHAS